MSIELRSKLPVHLDGDGHFVDKCSGWPAFKAFSLHDVAPVAGEIAHRDQQQRFALFGVLEGLLRPGLPSDFVVGVCRQIGRRVVLHPVL